MRSLCQQCNERTADFHLEMVAYNVEHLDKTVSDHHTLRNWCLVCAPAFVLDMLGWDLGRKNLIVLRSDKGGN